MPTTRNDFPVISNLQLQDVTGGADDGTQPVEPTPGTSTPTSTRALTPACTTGLPTETMKQCPVFRDGDPTPLYPR
jgi:hypothetical protein